MATSTRKKSSAQTTKGAPSGYNGKTTVVVWTFEEILRVSLVIGAVIILAILFSSSILYILKMANETPKSKLYTDIAIMVLMYIEFFEFSYIWFCLISEIPGCIWTISLIALLLSIIQLALQITTSGNLIGLFVFELIFEGALIYYLNAMIYYKASHN